MIVCLSLQPFYVWFSTSQLGNGLVPLRSLKKTQKTMAQTFLEGPQLYSSSSFYLLRLVKLPVLVHPSKRPRNPNSQHPPLRLFRLLMNFLLVVHRLASKQAGSQKKKTLGFGSTKEHHIWQASHGQCEDGLSISYPVKKEMRK